MANTNKNFHDFGNDGGKRLTLSEVKRFLSNSMTTSSTTVQSMVRSYTSTATDSDICLKYSSSSSLINNTVKYSLWVTSDKINLVSGGGSTSSSTNLAYVRTGTFRRDGTTNKIYGNNEVVPVYNSLTFYNVGIIQSNLSANVNFYPLIIGLSYGTTTNYELGFSDNEISKGLLGVGRGFGNESCMINGSFTNDMQYTTLSKYFNNAKFSSAYVPQVPTNSCYNGMHSFGAIQIKSVALRCNVTNSGSTSISPSGFCNTFSTTKYYYNNLVNVSRVSDSKILIYIDYHNMPAFATSSNTGNNWSYAINNNLIPIPYIMANIFFDQFLKSSNSGVRLYPNFLSGAKTTNAFYRTFASNTDGGVNFYYNTTNSATRYLKIVPYQIDIELEPNLHKIAIDKNILNTTSGLGNSSSYISFTNGLVQSITTPLRRWGGWNTSTTCTINVINTGNVSQKYSFNASGNSNTVGTESSFTISSSSTSSNVKIYYPAYLNTSDPSKCATMCRDASNDSGFTETSKLYTYWWFIDWNRANSSAYSFV